MEKVQQLVETAKVERLQEEGAEKKPKVKKIIIRRKKKVVEQEQPVP